MGHQFTFLVLGSDGIFDHMKSQEACDIVESSLRRYYGDTDRALDRLVKIASARSVDDCTAALAVWGPNELETPTRAVSERFLFNDDSSVGFTTSHESFGHSEPRAKEEEEEE